MSYVLKIDLKENAVPYKRTTQKAKWLDKDYKKYQAFKEFLKCEFAKQNKIYSHQVLDVKKTYEFKLKIGFKNKKHGDADNIVKGILDALFKSDKNVLKGKYEVVSFKKSFIELEINAYEFLEKEII